MTQTKLYLPSHVSEDRYAEAVADDLGWCTRCREFTGDFAEPDAERYECPECAGRTVYGVEQALLLGLVTIV